MRTPDHFEHITRYFYENPAGFRIFNFVAGEDYSGVRLTVDTQEDFNRIADLICRMDRPHWQYAWSEIVADLCAATH
jgi:spore coat polysaccharide biosynthesis protein SpsF (cytidylyltransferase family)